MYTFDGIKFVNQDNGESIVVGDELERVQKVLNLPDEKVIKPDDELAYFSIDEVVFGELTGKCSFTFEDEELSQIEYTPSLKGYLSELDKADRDGLYDCVYKAYKYFCNYIDNLGFDSVESDDRYTAYLIEDRSVSICIDVDYESVCVTQEINYE
ncbi:MAG: hypothetical protein E7386_01160 [Ruminococcaceae bacterium]|nr:hypothetical protein [Oscillospiraceae bacterium]